VLAGGLADGQAAIGVMNGSRLGRWVSRAACRGSAPGLFFPEEHKKDTVAAAKAVCAGCPVVRPCRAWALAHPAERGVWGGLTEAERLAVRHHQRQKATK